MNREEEEVKWLQNLMVGAKVAYDRHPARLTTVTKVTATQIVCGGLRFNRKTGKLAGSSGFRTTWLRPVTPEDEAEVVRRNLLWTLERMRWSGVGTDTLKAIVALLPV